MDPVARTVGAPRTRLEGRQPMPAPGAREPASLSRRFKHYRLDNVYLHATAAQRAETRNFWLREQALADPREAERRTREVVLMVRRDDTTELVGVSTVALQRLRDSGAVYVYRMFLRREDRIPYLMRAVTNASRDFLRSFPHPQAPVAGMLIVTENRKLMRPGIRRYFERHRYQYRGKTLRGLDLWLAPFDAAGVLRRQGEMTP
jgi:hypothetical protein